MREQLPWEGMTVVFSAVVHRGSYVVFGADPVFGPLDRVTAGRPSPRTAPGRRAGLARTWLTSLLVAAASTACKRAPEEAPVDGDRSSASILEATVARLRLPRTDDVTPWFRVESIPPPPGHRGKPDWLEVASVHVDGEWKEVGRGVEGLNITQLGNAVAIGPAYLGTDTPEELTVHIGGRRASVAFPRSDCPFSMIRADAPTIVCFGCGTEPPLRDILQSEECPFVTAREHAVDGQVLSSSTAPMLVPPEGMGVYVDWSLTPSGEVVFYATKRFNEPDPELKRFVLRRDRFEPLGAGERVLAPRDRWRRPR